MSEEPPKKRARSAVACRRCKTRKQRCDNGFPACAKCIASGADCSYEHNLYTENHVESMKARIVSLESQLADVSRGKSPSPRDVQPIAQSTCITLQRSLESENTLANTNGAFDMLSDSPDYLGASSGFSLARSVQAAIGLPSEPLAPRSLASIPQGNPKSTHGYRPSTFESRPVRESFLQAYLNKVHPKHMFLSPRRLYRLHEAFPLPRVSMDQKCESVILHMVYAIGARYLELSQEQSRGSPDIHYNEALRDLDCLFGTGRLQAIEGLILLSIYQLRSPTPPGIWSILGVAMRQAISLGLHRKYLGTSRLVDQQRKRIFWTLYMVDRAVARTLGRPVSISDRDIDISLPANVNVDVDNEEEAVSAMLEDPGPTAMSAAIHIIQLAQIESKIYSTMHRVDRSMSGDVTRKTARLRALLDEWKDNISLKVPNTNEQEDVPNYYVKRNYHILQYHKAMLLLLLPRLTRSPSAEEFRLCMTSAGQVGQLYKKLHDSQSSLSYSLLALHATFVAGLTLIYCFLTNSAVYDLNFASDIRACSTILYVVSERWAAARKIRDVFERIIANSVEKNAARPVPNNDSSVMGNNELPTLPSDGTEVLWAELTTLDPISTDMYTDASGLPYQNEDLWNSMAPWFDEFQAFG